MTEKNFLSDEISIVSDNGFDPFAIKHGGVDFANPEKAEEIIDDEDDKGDASKATVEKQTATQKAIQLSDDMINNGLEAAKKRAAGETDDDDDDKKDTVPGKQKDNSKPVKFELSEDDKKNAFTSHYKTMVAMGSWDEDKDFDGTEEKYLEIAEANRIKEVHAELDEYFEEAFEKNPQGKELGRKLFAHLQNGGTVSDFKTLYAPSEFKFEDIESDDDEVAAVASKSLFRNYYKSLGTWNDTQIEKKIEKLEKLGQLVDEARDLVDPYKQLTEQQQKIHSQDLAKQKASSTEIRRKINEGIEARLTSNKGVGDQPIYKDKKELNAFKAFMYEVKEDARGTEFQEQLNAAMKDPDFLVYMAQGLFKNLHKDSSNLVDKDKIKQQGVSKVREALEGALLHKDTKNIAGGDTGSDSSNRSQGSSKYKFNLDEAVVLS